MEKGCKNNCGEVMRSSGGSRTQVKTQKSSARSYTHMVISTSISTSSEFVYNKSKWIKDLTINLMKDSYNIFTL